MIIWKMKDSVENKAAKAEEIKTALEGLVGKIDGLISMHIITDKIDSSSGDIMMDSEFTDNDALVGYQHNPLHVEIAGDIVCPAVEQRLSFDYEV